MDGSKVNCFRRNLARNEHKIRKSVTYRCVERKMRIAKMYRLCKFIVALFGRFRLKCATHSFSGAWLPSSYRPGRCDSHLLYRLVGVNVRILRINLTLLLYWPIFSDMFCSNINSLVGHECTQDSLVWP